MKTIVRNSIDIPIISWSDCVFFLLMSVIHIHVTQAQPRTLNYAVKLLKVLQLFFNRFRFV